MLRNDWAEGIVDDRVVELETSYARLRRTVKGRKAKVTPHQPPDVIGCYVLVPAGVVGMNYATINIEGGLFPPDLLDRLAAAEVSVSGQEARDFALPAKRRLLRRDTEMLF